MSDPSALGSGAARRSTSAMTTAACHTARVGGYVVEGHVPAADMQRLLQEKPKALGLSVPSMPPGSPGMESSKPIPYQTLLVQPDGSTRVFAQH